jgi:hypothetical protein
MLVNVEVRAIPALLANRRKIVGSRLVKTYSHASSVNGSGMNSSLTESGSVLNDVTTDQANGTHMRMA